MIDHKQRFLLIGHRQWHTNSRHSPLFSFCCQKRYVKRGGSSLPIADFSPQSPSCIGIMATGCDCLGGREWEQPCEQTGPGHVWMSICSHGTAIDVCHLRSVAEDLRFCRLWDAASCTLLIRLVFKNTLSSYKYMPSLHVYDYRWSAPICIFSAGASRCVFAVRQPRWALHGSLPSPQLVEHLLHHLVKLGVLLPERDLGEEQVEFVLCDGVVLALVKVCEDLLELILRQHLSSVAAGEQLDVLVPHLSIHVLQGGSQSVPTQK